MASEQLRRDDELKEGDYVAWRIGVGEGRGRIVEKLTRDRKLNTRVFKASEDDPRFLIRFDKTGKEIIRRPQALRKIDENETEQTLCQEYSARDGDGGYLSEDEDSGEDLNKDKRNAEGFEEEKKERNLPHKEIPQPGQFTDFDSV